ncbi:MAG: AIR synthase-related protein, partial [Cyanobacteria bacterium J06555_13]
TRGGLASALNEISLAAHKHIQLTTTIPVQAEVQGACELLGLDPLYVANEGRFVAFVPASEATVALACLRRYHPSAQIIGSVTDSSSSQVTLQTSAGSERVLDLLSGKQLPRIC